MSWNSARQARKDQGEKGKKLADRHFIAFLAFPAFLARRFALWDMTWRIAGLAWRERARIPQPQ
jgi:hypothetical protein